MRPEPRSLVVLGATGSIGRSTLDLVRRDPQRRQVRGLSARRSVEPLTALADEFPESALHLSEPAAAQRLLEARPDLRGRLREPGEPGLLSLLEGASGSMVVNGLVGAVGLRPTVRALEEGHDVALANKEALVVGGGLVLDAARRGGGTIWPVDSEHSAIAQCLRESPRAELRRIWLTASGGPFRDRAPESFGSIRLEEVLRHPTWEMGPKITVDSATMMNKGLEVIEAHLLFDVALGDVRVVVHRQSIIHSMVELVDGAFLAQMGAPDMRIPILYALSGGRHVECSVAPWSPLDSPELSFESPDPRRYPCLELAQRAGEVGGTAPIVLNAANEEAVAGLLQGSLSFVEIPNVIERALERLSPVAPASVDDALACDRETRQRTRELVRERAAHPG